MADEKTNRVWQASGFLIALIGLIAAIFQWQIGIVNDANARQDDAIVRLDDKVDGLENRIADNIAEIKRFQGQQTEATQKLDASMSRVLDHLMDGKAH